MHVTLPEKWFDSDGLQYLAEVNKLCDRLSRSRIRPNVCDKTNRLCGDTTPSQTNDRWAIPCQEYAEKLLEITDRQETSRNKLGGKPFIYPTAQCILDWKSKSGETLFTNVLCLLGLLQTVVLTGQLSPRSNRYGLEHLETTIGLEMPWLRPSPHDGKPEFDGRREIMNGIFRDFREANDIQEFTNLLESEEGDELSGGTGSIQDVSELKLERLSLQEKSHQVLLVSDMEQSFFSLLFVLAAASEHARQLEAESGRDRRLILADWIDHAGVLLRSELCHTNRNLDPTRDEQEYSKGTLAYRPDSKQYRDRSFLEGISLKDTHGSHFLRASNFVEATYSLGFRKTREIKPDEDPNAEPPTQRFQRMIEWLMDAASTYQVTKDDADLLKEKAHPSLLTHAEVRGRKERIIHILQLDGFFLENQPRELSLNTLGQFCHYLLDVLGETNLLDSPESFSHLRDAVNGKPAVRFYLPGEYFLRKGESISRNFFAMALGYANDDPCSRAKIGAFAVGTLLDFERINDTTKPRLHALRQLLHTIAQFGIGYSQTKILTDLADKEARAKILHQLPKDMEALNEYLIEFKDRLETFRLESPSLGLPDFAMPDAMSVLLMFMRAQNDRKLFQLPPDCAELLAGEWNERTLSEFIKRVVWPASRSRVLADPEIIKQRQEGRLLWSGFSDMEDKFPPPRIKIKDPFKLRDTYGIYPLVLVALRNAFQHSYIATLLSESREQGEVEVWRIEEGHGVEIANSGQHPTSNQLQTGWRRDLDALLTVTGSWKVFDFGNSEYSKYDGQRERWITKIVFEERGTSDGRTQTLTSR